MALFGIENAHCRLEEKHRNTTEFLDLRGRQNVLALKRILVVDDNLSSRELLKFALEPHYRVEEAADGRDAVSRVRQKPPDLVLMDIQMPEMDGYEALREIRGNPDSASVPIVAITAFGMLEARGKAFEAGFDGYFVKPINLMVLRKEVDSLLKA